MSLKKIGKLISLFVLLCLLAWYSAIIFAGMEEGYLTETWNSCFFKLDYRCIHWIALRITTWIAIFLQMLRLENRFTIYLFIRKRSFWGLFAERYIKCLFFVLLYYGAAMPVMAVSFWKITGSGDVLTELFGVETVMIILRECLDSLNIGLFAYLLSCLTKRVEISFLTVLMLRLLIGLGLGERLPVVRDELYIHVPLAIAAFCQGARGFMERINRKA